jgi:hypothetical protein
MSPRRDSGQLLLGFALLAALHLRAPEARDSRAARFLPLALMVAIRARPGIAAPGFIVGC